MNPKKIDTGKELKTEFNAKAIDNHARIEVKKMVAPIFEYRLKSVGHFFNIGIFTPEQNQKKWRTLVLYHPSPTNIRIKNNENPTI